MITCTLGEKKYCVDKVTGRALREMEPAARMYAKIIEMTNAAVEGCDPAEKGDAPTLASAMDTLVRWFCILFGNQFTPDSHPECFSTAEIKSKKRQRTYPSVGVHIIGSINGKLPLYDALAIIANHFSFPDFSTRELYFFFCIALVIGVDSTPAAIPIIQTYFQFVSSPKRTISAAETSQYRI